MERSLTEVECEYFQGKQVGPKSYLCRRIELNAFTAPDLLDYTETGLQRHGVRGKVIPDELSMPALARDFFDQALSNRVDEMLAGLLSLEHVKAELGEAVRRHVPLDGGPMTIPARPPTSPAHDMNAQPLIEPPVGAEAHSVLPVADSYRKAGLSVLPVRRDGPCCCTASKGRPNPRWPVCSAR
jgi:hypothetical protein